MLNIHFINPLVVITIELQLQILPHKLNSSKYGS
jgi:hypothetical protein